MMKKLIFLIAKLAATGLAALLIIFALVGTHSWRLLSVFMRPVIAVGQPISLWMNHAFAPQGGGGFAGFGTVLFVDFALCWIEIWIVLMVAVLLFQMLVKQRRRERE